MPDLKLRLEQALEPRYRIEEEMVRGGMSRLFLAQEVALDRLVVVKVLPPELVSTVSVARFQREIAVAAHFQHPHILPILTAGSADALIYYVMPWVEGESLRERLRRDGRLGLRATLETLGEICDALSYAHAHGVVHRDVKPGNILLTGHHAVLVDFGVAHATAEAALDVPANALTSTGNFVGTAAYMAPEQLLDGHAVDGRADVFALGVVGYEALAGRLPYAEETPNQLLALQSGMRPPPLDALRPDVPERLAALIAQAIEPDLGRRLDGAASFLEAIGVELVAALPQRARSRRWRAQAVGVAGVALVGAAAITASLLRDGSAAAVKDELLAIAPFEVLPSELALWREGLVDVLSANLDGAGPLRTVSPATVLRGARGGAGAPAHDEESALALGRRTGARFVVFGRVLGAGDDSLRVTVMLVDVAAGRTASEVEVRGAADRMDSIADSITVAILREIGGRTPVSVVRRASIGSSSLPAVRAFLEGEQYFRRTAWDSARTAYERAIALDSGFALAHSHLGLTYAWQRLGTDSAARVHALRAGALNRGLAPRESLLVVADSLRSAAYGYAQDADYAEHVRRLLRTLEEATRRYEQDAEAWYRLADARFHFAVGRGHRVTEQEILDGFDRAIALDSAFAPAYIHPVELAFAAADPARALRYAHAYARLRPTDVSAAGTLLAAHLLAPRDDGDADALRGIMDTSSADLLFQAYSAARRATDEGGVALGLLRRISEGRPATYRPLADPAFTGHRLALQLSFRGRLVDAARIPAARRASVFAYAALAGALPAAEVRPVLEEWLRSDPRDPGFGMPVLVAATGWWLRERDTLALDRLRREATRRGRAGASSRAEARLARYVATVADASLALARADTATALARFDAIEQRVESPCAFCAVPRLVHARLLAATGRWRDAGVILADRAALLPSAIDVLWAMERGRVAERLGDVRTARESYAFVARAWRGGDGMAEPTAREARLALARLASSR